MSAKAFLTAVLFLSSPAYAVTFFLESQTGMSQIRDGSGYFNGYLSKTVTSPSTFGISFGMALMASLTDGRLPIELQVGLLPKLSSGSDDNGSYSFLSVYPTARLQISRIYVAGGATPWVYGRSGSGLGFDQLIRTSSSLAFFGEVGLLWPIVPDFSLGVSSSMTWISGGASTSTLIDGAFLMRFYLGSIGNGTGAAMGASSPSNEFRGWRYPFGNLR